MKALLYLMFKWITKLLVFYINCITDNIYLLGFNVNLLSIIMGKNGDIASFIVLVIQYLGLGRG